MVHHASASCPQALWSSALLTRPTRFLFFGPVGERGRDQDQVIHRRSVVALIHLALAGALRLDAHSVDLALDEGDELLAEAVELGRHLVE